MIIGMYAHHDGSGHLHRVSEIRRHFGPSTQATVFSSRPGADYTLPLDTPAQGADPTAGGILHYAPLRVGGLTERMACLADWVNTHRPDAFYVDVSVEVTLFLRLLGVPVVTLAMPGERGDRPHQTGYTLASAIIAAWPEWVTLPTHLRPHRDKLVQVGGITRLAPQEDVLRGDDIVVLRGAGPDNFSAAELAGVTVLGGDTRVDDPMPYLQQARCVIAAAGQNSVADIAAAHAPAIVVAQQRPFGEQHATARILDQDKLAVAVDHWPQPDEWPDLIPEATRRARNWPRWHTDGAGRRAARVIEEVARSCPN